MLKTVNENFTRVTKGDIEIEYHYNGIVYITETLTNGKLTIVKMDYDVLKRLLEEATKEGI